MQHYPWLHNQSPQTPRQDHVDTSPFLNPANTRHCFVSTTSLFVTRSRLCWTWRRMWWASSQVCSSTLSFRQCSHHPDNRSLLTCRLKSFYLQLKSSSVSSTPATLRDNPRHSVHTISARLPQAFVFQTDTHKKVFPKKILKTFHPCLVFAVK